MLFGTEKMMDFYDQIMRRLDDGEEAAPPPKWQLIFMSVLMVVMFAFLIADRIAPDHVFVVALAFCMVTGIVDSKEGLKGFANEGVLTVMVRMRCKYKFCLLLLRCPVSALSSPLASALGTPPNNYLLLHHLLFLSVGAVCSSTRPIHDWCN